MKPSIYIVDDFGTRVSFTDKAEAIQFFRSRQDCLKDEHRRNIRFLVAQDFTEEILASRVSR